MSRCCTLPFAPEGPTILLALLALATVAATLAGCGGTATEKAAATASSGPEGLAGVWRLVLASPGGELPCHLRVDAEGGTLRAVVLNGEEEAPISGVEVAGDRAVFRFDHYDAELEGRRVGADRIEGRWRRTGAKSDAVLPFVATKVADGSRIRFLPTDLRGAALASVDGAWAVEFDDDGQKERARGEFRQEGARVLGTFLTPTGDHRFLEGTLEHGVLRLSAFDGSHAYLYQAVAQPDGSLRGDFWARESSHSTWTATPAGEGGALPDAWSQVGLKNADGAFGFRFPDLEGGELGLDDPRFRGKVVVVNLFGSWCPNCNDEAPLLAEWDRRYRARGLEIVGLAYEYTGKVERDRQQVRRYAARHGIGYPVLLAGISDKQAAAATLPDLTAIAAFPTTIFLGRDGKVRKIHSGFAGPGTGRHHQELVAELEALLQRLLAEAP
jgi:thiol-disulfide isomerase/thioredoxin